jgi:O-antigen/teichoic acid export membrane protein
VDPVRRIAKNSFFVLAARLLEVIFNLVILTQVARYLGIDRFGVYSFVLAIIWVLSPMLFLGLNQILAREVAVKRETAPDFLGNALVLNVVMVLPVLLCAVAAKYIFGLDPVSTVALFIAVGYFTLDAFIRNFFGVVIAFEDTKYMTLITFVRGLVELVLILTVVSLDLGFVFIFAASAAAKLIAVLAALFLFRRRFALPRINVDPDGLYRLLRACLPLMVSLFLINGFLYVDVFMLKLMASNADVGLFQAPHKILTRMQVLPVSFFIALLPVFSRLARSEGDFHKFKTLFEKIFKVTLIFALPVSIIGIAMSHEIVLFLFGEAFFRAGLSLSILLCAFPFLCITTLYRYLLISTEKQGLVMFSDGICLFVNFLLDLVLVPRFGFMGASFGTLSALVIQSVTTYFFLGPLRGLSWRRSVFAPVISALIFVAFLFGSGRRDSLLLLSVGIAFYVGMLIVSKAFSVEDVNYIKRAVGPRKN